MIVRSLNYKPSKAEINSESNRKALRDLAVVALQTYFDTHVDPNVAVYHVSGAEVSLLVKGQDAEGHYYYVYQAYSGGTADNGQSAHLYIHKYHDYYDLLN